MINQPSGSNQPGYQAGNQRNLLERVHEGMKVFDRDGKEIGKVNRVQLSGVDQNTENRGQGPVTTQNTNPNQPQDTFVRDVNRMFDDDQMPQELRERLLRNGFVRIDSKGLLSRDRYVMPDQIANVTSDEVHLNASRDELIKQ